MRTTKLTTPRKLLALLLALILAVGFALPALADGEDSIYPVFTKTMPIFTLAKTGQTVVLEGEARLPEGVEAELCYQWYATDWYAFTPPDDAEFFPLEGATESKLETFPIFDEIGVEDAFRGIMPIRTRNYRLRAYYIDYEASLTRNTYCTTSLIVNGSFDDARNAFLSAFNMGDAVNFFSGIFNFMSYPFALFSYVMGELMIVWCKVLLAFAP